jgi:vancomycin resistance protein YoaR
MVNGQVATIGRGTVTRWIEPGPVEDGLMPQFVAGRTQRSVERLLAGLIDPGTPPVFSVEAGEVVVELGAEPMRCCAEGVAEELYETAAQGHLRIARLDPVPVYDDAGAAAAEELGIRELVGSFTTRHACCQSRVENIHRIADIVRGVVIEPGGRFSINEFVGRRTRENGFVAAGVISQGHFTDDVGGGISQFATTTFNAAFFAGLDIPTYQSHSIYISRYPYGREATLSYPAPDLELVNNTPYGMLLWTSYDDRSITVEIYSTPFFEVEQTGQSRFGWGACTRVETYRSRTDPTGDVIEDTFFATYRPGEGLDCAGNRTPNPEG